METPHPIVGVPNDNVPGVYPDPGTQEPPRLHRSQEPYNFLMEAAKIFFFSMAMPLRGGGVRTTIKEKERKKFTDKKITRVKAALTLPKKCLRLPSFK